MVANSDTLRLCYSMRLRLQKTVRAIDLSRAQISRGRESIQQTAGRLFECRHRRGTQSNGALYQLLIAPATDKDTKNTQAPNSGIAACENTRICFK
jgi:hypothetical protein